MGLAKNKRKTEICLLILIFITSALCEYVLHINGSMTLLLLLVVFGAYCFSASSKHAGGVTVVASFFPVFGHLPVLQSRLNNRLCDVGVRSAMSYTDEPLICTALPLGQNLLSILDPKIAEYIFTERFNDFEKGQQTNEILHPMLGDGIFTSDGDQWRMHRSIASRIFTVRSLKDYMFDTFMETSNLLMDKLEELRVKADTADTNDDGGINLFDLFNRLTLQAFTHIAFGVKVGCIQSAPKTLEFAYCFDRALSICTTRLIDPVWKLKKWLNIGTERELKTCLKSVNKFVRDVIQEKKLIHARDTITKTESKDDNIGISVLLDDDNADADVNGNGKHVYRRSLKKKYDLLSLFLGKNPNLTYKELRDISLNFIIAGRDTTAQTLSWACYELSKNPNVLHTLLQEMNELFETEEALDYNGLQKLKYMECVFYETLRLHPSVLNMVRFAKKDVKIPGINKTILKGDCVVLSQYIMGRNPKVWKNPSIFDPNRFLNKDHALGKYPAFNLKPRVCLGKHVAIMEAKIALFKFLKRYEFSAMEKSRFVTYQFGPTNVMKGGFFIRLTPVEKPLQPSA